MITKKKAKLLIILLCILYAIELVSLAFLRVDEHIFPKLWLPCAVLVTILEGAIAYLAKKAEMKRCRVFFLVFFYGHLALVTLIMIVSVVALAIGSIDHFPLNLHHE